MVEEHRRIRTVADLPEWIGVQFGINQVIHRARQRQRLGDGRDNHRMPKIGGLGGVRPDGVDRNVVGVVFIGPHRVGGFPNFEAAHQRRGAAKDGRALDAQDAGHFREIAIVTNMNADGADLGLENGVVAPGGRPAIIRQALGGKRMGFAINAQAFSSRIDHKGRIIDHTTPGTALIGRQHAMDLQLLANLLDRQEHVVGPRQPLVEFAHRHRRIVAGGDGFGKNQQLRAHIFDCPAQKMHTAIKVGGNIVGDHCELGAGDDQAFSFGLTFLGWWGSAHIDFLHSSA